MSTVVSVILLTCSWIQDFLLLPLSHVTCTVKKALFCKPKVNLSGRFKVSVIGMHRQIEFLLASKVQCLSSNQRAQCNRGCCISWKSFIQLQVSKISGSAMYLKAILKKKLECSFKVLIKALFTIVYLQIFISRFPGFLEFGQFRGLSEVKSCMQNFMISSKVITEAAWIAAYQWSNTSSLHFCIVAGKGHHCCT